MNKANLTEDQKQFIQKNKDKLTDLGEMTRSVFMDESLDGRTTEGRSVREYLIEIGQKFDTTKAAPAKNITLSEEQKSFISGYAKDGMNAFQISKIILGHKNIIIDHAKKILERDQEIYELKVKLGIIKEEPKEDEKI